MNPKEKSHLLGARHFIEKIVGKGDLSAYDQMIAEDAVGHCPDSWKEIHPNHVIGRENTKKIDLHYANAFQWLSVDIADITCLEDKVFVRWTCEKIHRDVFYGIEPTHNRLSIVGQTCLHFQGNGQIKEIWQSWDMFGLLRQIGGFPNACAHINRGHFNQTLKLAKSLTQREKQCLKLQAQGKTAKESALSLFVSPRTVEYYFENIKAKLACENKKEVFQIARILESYGVL